MLGSVLVLKSSCWLKVCVGSLSRTVTSPEAWSVTTMSGSELPLKSATVMSDGVSPTGTEIGAANFPGAVWSEMVTLLFRELATIRSSRPLPVRSAAMRLVGRSVVEKAMLREKPASGLGTVGAANGEGGP